MNAIGTIQHSVEQPDWFASWFDSTHYHRLYAHRDEREAIALVDRLVDELQPRAGASMLDLGCGSGRHAWQLAARGFRVTGIDLSSESLAMARRRYGPGIRLRRQDMREPFGSAAFEHVLSLFTSFGYFEDPADHRLVIGNIARSLTAGGTVVL